MSARNPPAFPRPHSNDETPSSGLHQWNHIDFSDAQDGMSLRDYFAAQCLPSVISAFSFMEPDHGFPQPSLPAEVAAASYLIADAMLKAREQEPTP